MIVRQMTAAGRGAVAVVSVTCDAPEEISALNHFQSIRGVLPVSMKTGDVRYGNWRSEDVVLLRKSESTWEIHCHGGVVAVDRILTDLGGESECLPFECRLRERLHQLLLKSTTLKTCRYLLAQRDGQLEKFLRALLTCEDAVELHGLTAEYLRWKGFARHLLEPRRVAVIGLPNAGKSSLLNVLVGFNRSIVHSSAGTTRDRVAAATVLDGWPFEFVDTAGIREATSDPIEMKGIQVAESTIADCELCLLVVDSQRGWTEQDQRLRQSVASKCPLLIAWNKTDISGPQEPPATADLVVECSARTEEGVNEILAAIVDRLVPQIPEVQCALPVIPELTQVIEETLAAGDMGRLRTTLDDWLD